MGVFRLLFFECPLSPSLVRESKPRCRIYYLCVHTTNSPPLRIQQRVAMALASLLRLLDYPDHEFHVSGLVKLLLLCLPALVGIRTIAFIYNRKHSNGTSPFFPSPFFSFLFSSSLKCVLKFEDDYRASAAPGTSR